MKTRVAFAPSAAKFHRRGRQIAVRNQPTRPGPKDFGHRNAVGVHQGNPEDRPVPGQDGFEDLGESHGRLP